MLKNFVHIMFTLSALCGHVTPLSQMKMEEEEQKSNKYKHMCGVDQVTHSNTFNRLHKKN